MSKLRQLLNTSLLLYLTTTTYAVNCPHNCKCAWVLDSLVVNCAHKKLTEQPDFADLPIDHLDLSYNNLNKFPTQLADIESLVFLDLSSNKISHLEADALVGFVALRVLLLAHNNFTSWLDLNPSVAFRNAISLKYLSLSGNNLETFTGYAAEHTLISESLNELELKNCGIVAVAGDHLINGLPSLDRLMLSGNALTTLKSIPSPSLRTLELSNCSLQHIPPALIEGLPNLQTLNISWNFALELKDALISESLLQLDVSFCNLDTINLSGFPSLAHALLRGNMLRQLDHNTFGNNNRLEVVDLARNSLRNIQTDAFTKLQHLTTIDLSYNEIARLDKNLFRANDALVSINLSRNAIEKFSKLISNSIREINFSGCEIIMIDSNALTGLSAIQRIDLSHTLIKEFPPYMRSETLQRLDLSNCKLSAIRNTTFSGFPELAWLYLNGNRFTNPIPADYFRSNHYLDAVWISDNPWICNCHDMAFMDFYDFLTAEPQKLKDHANVRCASPANFYGKTWETACANYWEPRGRSSTAEKAWTTIMLLILIVGVGTFAFSCVQKYLKRRKRRRDRREYRENHDEMLEIRAQNERMLEEAGTPNAPNFYENTLPTYEDALRMQKVVRPVKSMVDLTENGQARRAKLRRIQTNPDDGDIDDADLLLDDRQRFRSEEMLSNRDKERTAFMMPFARTGYVEYNKSRSRRLSVEDARFPAAHMKSQNLQSAEKIGNFQSYEHSPYTKRRPKVADIPPFKRATVRPDSVEFLTDPEYEDHSKPGSPFARRKPKTPTTVAAVDAASYRPLAPAVEDYFGSVQKSHHSSLDDSDFQLINEPDNSSIAELRGTSSGNSGDGGESATNLERGRRKKRLNSTSRRASGNFTAAGADDSSSSSDREPIVVVHKPMRETLF